MTLKEDFFLSIENYFEEDKMKTLVLAEKPSVGKDLARVLKCGNRGKSFCEGTNYVVTWAMGHLVTLSEPADYDIKWKEWNLEYLPMLPEKMKLKVLKKTSNQYKIVSKLFNRKDINEIVIATDSGREGELVARWALKLSGCRKPIKRLWISSQTDAAIKQGFATLKPGKNYENLYQAAVCRSEADWIIGLNVTRALTCKFDAQLSAGRVQTPTLSMIVTRESEIKNFVPKDFWTIKADFGDFFGTWRDKNKNSRIFSNERANSILKKIEGQQAIIEDVQRKNKSEQPPLLYDLTELQREANKKFSFSAKKTLSIVQSLYERHKATTYPRTDSRYITSDMVSSIPQRLIILKNGSYQKTVEALLRSNIRPGNRVVNNSRVTEHHALIPTEQKPHISSFSIDEKRIYDLIVRRFLAVLLPPFKYIQTTIMTDIRGEKFFSRGKVVVDYGWQKIEKLSLEEDIPENHLPEQTLKPQNKGKKIFTKKIRLEKSQTKPPKRYTEASLLTAMESPGKFIEDENLRESIKEGGLGTPATRAEIIDRLFSAYYAERRGKSIVPTSKGIQLISLVPEELRSPKLTAAWEKRLHNIAIGKEKRMDFMKDIRNNVVRLVSSVKTNTSEYHIDNLTKNKCPICGKFMMQVQNKSSKMLVCSDRKCGYEQSDKDKGGMRQGRISKKEKYMNKSLVKKYGKDEKKDFGGTLGDLFDNL